MAIITIKGSDFVRGHSSSDFLDDGGFSPESLQLNLTRKRGVLHFSPSYTVIGDAILTGNLIASCIDPEINGNDVYYVDNEGAFYTLDGATFTKQQTTTGYTYSLGTTTIIPFRGEVYVTSGTAIARLGSNMATLTEDWWSRLTNGYRHPMEHVEDNLFIADNNVIYYWNGTASGVAFTLPNRSAVTTLRRHPDGTHLLAFTSDNAQNFSHTLGGAGKVYFCNTSLVGVGQAGWSREVSIEAQVEGTRVVGGIVFCCYGGNFGYFDGNGLQLLRKIDNSGTTYSHSMGNLEDTVIYRDGRNVVAYGNIGSGNVFWKCARNTVNASDLGIIHYLGDNKLLLSPTTGDLLRQIDFDDAGANGTFFTNRYHFETEVIIHKLEFIHDASDPLGTTSFLVRSVDEAGTQTTIDNPSFTNQSNNKTTIHCDVKTDMFQLVLSLDNDDIGFHAIKIHYEPNI